jgi:peptidoglycan/LPS O-acetylase OafA/YrhL
LAVVAFHAFPANIHGGFIGVDIFFVISGYLISSIIIQGLERGRFSYREFYVRRIRRIFPALTLVLATCLIGGWTLLFAEEYRFLGKHVAGGAGFIDNILSWGEAGYFDKRHEFKALLHLWSLGVEEQYYLIWPIFLSLFFRTDRILLSLIGTLLVLSFALNVLFVSNAPDSTFYLLHTRLWELMMGSLLACITLHAPRLHAAGTWLARVPQSALSVSKKTVAELISASGILLIGYALLRVDENTKFPGWWAALPTLGTFLVIAAGPNVCLNRHVLGSKPLVLIGLISYPLYLWHWPLLAFARILSPNEPTREIRIAIVLASVALAWLTFQLLEKPIRARASKQVALVLLVIAALICASGALVSVNEGFPSRAVNSGTKTALVSNALKENERIRDSYEAGTQPCDERISINSRARANCFVYGGARTNTIVVWGDSHAGAWAPLFYRIADERNLRVVLLQYGGCPPIIGVRRVDSAGRALGTCSDFGTAESIIDAIRSIHPTRVFVIGRWDVYPHNPAFETVSAVGGGSATFAAELRKKLVGTLSTVASIAPVTVFRGMPHLLNDSQRALLRGFALEPALENHRREQAEIDAAIDEAHARSPNISVFDPASRTCTTICTAVIGNTVLYTDDNHISAQGALLFTQDLLGTTFLPAPES